LPIAMAGDRDVVRVSAPGKLLLLGEHAVVYGCPVVAAALSDLRIQAEIVRRRGDGP
jgi:mevalonate kinase